MASGELADFINAVSGEDRLAVEESFGDGFVRLRTAEAERRQAKHDIRAVEDIVIEMLRNARDAHAGYVFVATGKAGSIRTLTFLDDGDGIPEAMQEHIFEPRVTSKLQSMVMDRWGVHGRGMALYSIKCNTLEAQVLQSGKSLGSSFGVKIDLNELPEKTDQSTYPHIFKDEEGKLVVGRGPHNMVRTIVEFALESKERTVVYYGSPTEIVAALFEYGKRRLSDEQILFCDDVESLPVCLRPAAAADALDLVEICSALGLPISERTAHRIMAGQIEPCVPPLKTVMGSGKAHARQKVDIYRDSRGLKIAPEDLGRFANDLERAFDTLAQRYYLSLTERPRVRVGKDCISVKFSIDKEL